MAILLLAAAGSVGMGCASLGVVIVDVDFDVQISGTDVAGKVWHAKSSEISKHRHPQSASPFPNVHFGVDIFEGDINAGATSFGIFIRSKIPGAVCFRFDQALLSSNTHPQPAPLRVNGYLRSGEDTCVTPEKGKWMGFIPVLTELFPSGQMFNINQAGNSTNYTERGVGNWLKITVPIEYLGKREIVEVTMTALDSRARRFY